MRVELDHDKKTTSKVGSATNILIQSPSQAIMYWSCCFFSTKKNCWNDKVTIHIIENCNGNTFIFDINTRDYLTEVLDSVWNSILNSNFLSFFEKVFYFFWKSFLSFLKSQQKLLFKLKNFNSNSFTKLTHRTG